MRIVVMGVTGSGKTTVGKLLAERIGHEFIDADDHHSKANIEKMRAGIPLDDDNRGPWLEGLRDILAAKENVVLACSALKHSYRQTLAAGSDAVRFVFLKADPETIRRRMESRPGHFMNLSLINSQFETLEPPTHALTLSADSDPRSQVDEIIAALNADL